MTFDYTITYSERKTLGLVVGRDRAIVVQSPHAATPEQVAAFVERKKMWLYQKVREERKYPEQPYRKPFVSGESLLYMGRHYRLRVVPEAVVPLVFDDGFTMPKMPPSQARTVIEAWCRERAQEIIPPRVRHWARQMGLEYGKVEIAEMRTMWASCTPNNAIRFRWQVIKASLAVIDYLAVHELAHLRVPNHTPAFWNVVSVQLPEYETQKRWLQENGNLLEEDF